MTEMKALSTQSMRLLAFFLACHAQLIASEVRIERDSQGHYVLLKDGKPTLIKGANWPNRETVETLALAGGNSIRTYGDEIEWMLPLAKKYGFTILAGLHIGRERQGFDYEDQKALDEQFERLRATVRKYKNEPEILMWAIGNEPELLAKKTVPLWKEVNRIAQMVRAEDPHHPIITVVAGFDENKIRELVKYCTDLDALGVNWYGPVRDWPENLQKFGWIKPYLHSEFGPAGYWPGGGGAGDTKWGAPIEQTSTEKAAFYAENWQNAVHARPGQSLGGYAFIWTTKQERTHTWFSMFLSTGQRTAAVDAMQEAWTGTPPKHPAPEILEWKPERNSGEFQPNETVRIGLRWKCDRPVTVNVEIRAETTAKGIGGDSETVPVTLPDCKWQLVEGGLEVLAPDRPGPYRIFVQITTEDRTAATANLPILVHQKHLVTP